MIEVDIDPHALENLMGKYLKQTAYVAQKAINDTLFHARKDQIKKMQQNIDGGATRWTVKSLRYDKAKKSSLQGTLYFSGDRKYMKTIMEGGTVTAKKQVLVAPVKGKVRLNKYGNLTKNKIQALKANEDRYFVGKRSERSSQKTYGLWKRVGRGKNEKIERVVYMNIGSRKARKTYKGREYAQTFIKKEFMRNVRHAFKRAIATAR